MDAVESISVAFEALRSNKVRSALTMLGVVIGVLSVILLISIGEGARRYVAGELEGLGSNILIITQGKTETSGGSMMMATTGTTHKITYDDAKAIERRGWAITDAVPAVLGTSRIKRANRGRDTTIIGVTPQFERVRNMHVEIGSFITQTDVDASRRVAVLGRVVKKELFGDKNALGSIVALGDSRYRVVGVMAPKGVTFGMDLDDVVFIPVSSGQDLFDTDRLFEVLVQVGRKEDMDAAKAQIKDVLVKRHDGREDFTITDQGAMMSAMDNIMDIMTTVLAGIAGISLLVGGIGIMNIMLVSVRERTREIGIRKAVGATRRDILLQFLAESAALSITGGAVGMVLAVGTALALPYFTPLPTGLSVWAVALAFGFSAAVGVFFGVYPAVKASRLDPIEALRYE